MKLDPAALRYLSEDDFRVLTAIEMGMRNHDIVPVALVSVISGLRHGGYMKSLKEVHKHKLVHKESRNYVGYRLTSLGYDFLALRALVKRGVIEAVGRAIGVGKEADVFLVSAAESLLEECPEISERPHLAMKLHRLGRTSFRAVKSKRDYLVHRKSASWIYLSRLAAMKEYAFMCALHERGFPVPRPLGQSRHVVIMELCEGVPLTQVAELGDPVAVGNFLLDVCARFAQHGLVHCDLNEFNVMIDDDENVTVIDFPQMVSTRHVDAVELFDRDVRGITRFFEHRYGISEHELRIPDLEEILDEGEDEEQLDIMVAASGFKNTSSKAYGEQDFGIEDAGGTLHGDAHVQGINMSTLELPVAAELVDATAEGDGSKAGSDYGTTEPDVPGDGAASEERDADQDTASCAGSEFASGIDRTLIADRVRRQRGNQKQRKQLSKRNVVKDSEKRKVKNEMSSGLWS